MCNVFLVLYVDICVILLSISFLVFYVGWVEHIPPLPNKKKKRTTHFFISLYLRICSWRFCILGEMFYHWSTNPVDRSMLVVF